MTDRATIFAVDDEPEELARIRRALERRFAADYDIAAEASPGRALERLRQLAGDGRQVALVLADLNMLDTGGIAFLTDVDRVHPDAKRVGLITWGELEAMREQVLGAVAGGHIDGVVAKPWRDAHESFYRELTNYLEEWDHTHRPQFEAVRLVARQWDASAQQLRDVLHRSGVPFGSYDADSPAGKSLLEAAGTSGPLPVAIVHDGQALTRPSTHDLAAALHVNTDPVGERYDVTIVGSGPAGLAAAVYGSSEGLSVLVVEHAALGGQASSSAMIRNYLGFPRGLSGAELTARGYRQAWFFGTRFVIGRNAAGLEADGEDRIVVLDDGTRVRSRAVILAAGVTYRRLPIDSIDRLTGRGVYYGAPVTEAPGMAGQHVVVVGGGNSSAQMALYMARYAGQVTVVTRNSALGEDMSDYLVRDIRSRATIDVRLNTAVIGVDGGERLTGVRLRQLDGDAEEMLPAAGLFIMIGAEPRTDWLPEQIERDPRGYVATGDDVTAQADGHRPRSLETSMPGVFAVGDVRLGSLKRIAAAVGEGSTVVRMCHDYLAHQLAANQTIRH